MLTETRHVPRVHRRRLGQIHRHVLGVVLVGAIRVGDGDAVAVELLLVDEVADRRQSQTSCQKYCVCSISGLAHGGGMQR